MYLSSFPFSCRAHTEEVERKVKEEAILKKRAVRSLLGSAYFDEDGEEDGEEDEMIEPAPEMRAVMEKLVAFVKKNGPAFEAKVRIMLCMYIPLSISCPHTHL